MYHTPNLTGLRKRCLPRRINEGWGLQHMKLYGVDNDIMLSGANLSSDYFTNRQDRYHLFASAQLTEHFWKLHRAVGSVSFLVEPPAAGDAATAAAGFALNWPGANAAPSPLEAPQTFVAGATAALRSIVAPAADAPPRGAVADTRVYVLAQMSQLLRPDASTELPAVTRILERLAEPAWASAQWTFTAGYFNPAPSLTRLLLGTAAARATVIAAAPEANGFYRSPGVSGLLPAAYVLLARRFLRAAGAVRLKEWRRGTAGVPGGWTYHAKGLWVTLPGDALPALTVVGSSNYTRRSYSLDLEAGAVVVTRDPALRRRLAAEERWLQDHARVITHDDFARNDRRVGLGVRVSMCIVGLVGGAL